MAWPRLGAAGVARLGEGESGRGLNIVALFPGKALVCHSLPRSNTPICPSPDSNKPPVASYQDRLALVLTPGARAKSGLQRLLFTYSVLIGFAAMRLV